MLDLMANFLRNFYNIKQNLYFRSSQKMNGHVGNEHWTSNSSPRSKINGKDKDTQQEMQNINLFQLTVVEKTHIVDS